MATTEAVVASMADTARAAGIAIVTGDTKVVPRGAADKLFINTAGIGAIPADIRWGRSRLAPVMCCWSAARWGSWRHHP